MFQDFAKKKFDDYLALLEFPAGRITFNQLRTSTLPPFIISFFEYYVTKKNAPLDKKDFEEILDKAIIFNINYIIKPKNTIVKFLFGDMETRPVHFVKDRLKYFQFYGYYITQIVDFINVNLLEVVSVNQIEHLINDVNKKLLEEISAPGNDSQRMNLVKLLYYFFHDLGDNNPINIKIPQKILSVYFQDKGYYDIKKRVDGFFSDEIFIQEALELMDPETKKASVPKSSIDANDEEVTKIITKAKSDKKAKDESNAKDKAKSKDAAKVKDDPKVTEQPKPEMETEAIADTKIKLISATESNEEVEKILKPEEEIPIEIIRVNIEELREQEAKLPEIEKSRLVIDEEIYSDDLMFASQFSDLTPPAQLTEKEIREKLIKDLFCEESYRKKIIKQIFRKNEDSFKETVNYILNLKSWNEAAAEIEELFAKRKVNYFSEASVKFVDIMQSHFVKDSEVNAVRKEKGNKAV